MIAELRDASSGTLAAAVGECAHAHIGFSAANCGNGIRALPLEVLYRG